MRSASEKPSSLLILARTSSALKCTALSRGASTWESVVLPAPGNPITRILRFMNQPELHQLRVLIGMRRCLEQETRWRHHNEFVGLNAVRLLGTCASLPEPFLA